VLDLLDDFDIRATFFVVADVVDHYPGLVESIVERGHEIGCHGLHHACKIDPKTKEPLMSVKEFEKRTLKAKEMLERVCKDKVIGYRAPNALVGGWMLDSLAKIGFKYDSSISVNSLYNKTDSSLEGVSSHPYYPKKNSLGLEIGEEKGKKIVEFPWAYWNVFGFNFNFKIPTSGGPMLRFLGAHVILKGLKQSLKRGHTIFYFHPIDISVEKFPKVGKGRPLYWVVKGKLVEKRIRYILKNLKEVNKACLKDALCD
jgi:peptidoglycan/xylan/chitin deacetylase (PgdA/CDA1 family)